MSDTTNIPSPDDMLASAAKFLIEGDDYEAASVLLACEIIDVRQVESDNWDGRFT